jgi:hypothetical protein
VTTATAIWNVVSSLATNGLGPVVVVCTSVPRQPSSAVFIIHAQIPGAVTNATRFPSAVSQNADFLVSITAEHVQLVPPFPLNKKNVTQRLLQLLEFVQSLIAAP